VERKIRRKKVRGGVTVKGVPSIRKKLFRRKAPHQPPRGAKKTAVN